MPLLVCVPHRTCSIFGSDPPLDCSYEASRWTRRRFWFHFSLVFLTAHLHVYSLCLSPSFSYTFIYGDDSIGRLPITSDFFTLFSPLSVAIRVLVLDKFVIQFMFPFCPSRQFTRSCPVGQLDFNVSSLVQHTSLYLSLSFLFERAELPLYLAVDVISKGVTFSYNL